MLEESLDKKTTAVEPPKLVGNTNMDLLAEDQANQKRAAIASR